MCVCVCVSCMYVYDFINLFEKILKAFNTIYINEYYKIYCISCVSVCVFIYIYIYMIRAIISIIY